MMMLSSLFRSVILPLTAAGRCGGAFRSCGTEYVRESHGTPTPSVCMTLLCSHRGCQSDVSRLQTTGRPAAAQCGDTSAPWVHAPALLARKPCKRRAHVHRYTLLHCDCASVFTVTRMTNHSSHLNILFFVIFVLKVNIYNAIGL